MRVEFILSGEFLNNKMTMYDEFVNAESKETEDDLQRFQ
jgi:hypothetical protein